jgi:hypothetical protein
MKTYEHQNKKEKGELRIISGLPGPGSFFDIQIQQFYFSDPLPKKKTTFFMPSVDRHLLSVFSQDSLRFYSRALTLFFAPLRLGPAKGSLISVVLTLTLTYYVRAMILVRIKADTLVLYGFTGLVNSKPWYWIRIH